MDTNNENQINELFNACEQLNNLFCGVYNIAVNCNAPTTLKTDLSDITSELHNAIFRIANFIALPQSENIAPELEKKLDDYLEFVADKSVADCSFNQLLQQIAPDKVNDFFTTQNKK